MLNFDKFSGKVAVVTGGASGIGLGLAQRFAAEGMQVVIADLDGARAAAMAEPLGGIGRAVDVSKAGDLAALAEEVMARYGRIDLLCNNAGIGPAAAIRDLTEADWRWMLDVNLWGVIHGISAFLPLLRANPEGGWIVNTSSMAGLRPVEGLGAYVAAKYAVTGLSETLAAELATEGAKVGVTLLCPGPVRSNIGQSLRYRPKGEEAKMALRDVDISKMGHHAAGVHWRSPEETAEIVVQALRQGALYAITHPEQRDRIEARFAQLLAAFPPNP